MSIVKDKEHDAGAPQRQDYRSAPRLLGRFIGNHRTLMAKAILSGVIAGICEIAPAWIVWQLVVSIVAHGRIEPRHLVIGVIGALLAVVGKAVFFGLSTATAHLIAFDVIAGIRHQLGRCWNSQSVGSVARVHSSQAKTVALDHCEKLELFIAHALPESAAACTVWLSITVWLFSVDWKLALATIILTVIGFAMMLHAMRANGHRMGDWVEANGAMQAAVLDFLTAMPVIRVFNRTGEDHRRTTVAVERNAELQSQWGKAFVGWGAPFSTLVASSITLIAPLGAWLLARDSVEPAAVLLFLILGPTYSVPLVTMFYRLVQIPILSAGAVEIEKQLALGDREAHESLAEPEPAPSSHESSAIVPDVRFDHVNFSFTPGVQVLHDISFHARAGELTALVGVSGSGKSTIGELTLGFYQPDSGSITIGGRDVRNLSDVELYQDVAAVFQRPYLLAGTIRDNVTLARPDAPAEDIEAALDAAAVSSFVGALPAGLDTPLGEGGSGLSGGEKQRVAIARALLADKPVLVLDEATAATDPDNEAVIQQGLSRLAAGRTVLVIAHRLNTIRHADTIYVLSQGRIVESGTHEHLLERGGEYARLWKYQQEAKSTHRGQEGMEHS